jgi:LytR cell envelope-related transcriptional attenuator
MSAPKNGGPDNRLRKGALALFALAVIAALIGLVMVITRGGQTTPPGPATATSAHPLPPSVIPFPPVSTTPEAPAVIPPVPAPVQPGPVQPGPAQPAEAAPLEQAAPAGGKGASRGEVRVYNNSMIHGLAARAADDLRAAGWAVVEVGNYPWGIIPTTTVYYEEGTDQRAAAEAIASEFGMRVEPRFPGIAHANPGIIVIVTKDYRN